MNKRFFCYAGFLTFSLLFFVLIIISASMLNDLILFTCYSVLLVYINPAKDALSPINWFVPFNWVYSVTYPVYLWFFGLEDEYSYNLVLCSFLAAFSFGLATLDFKAEGYLKIPCKHGQFFPASRIAVFFFSVPVLVSLLYAIQLGIGSKREFIDMSRVNPVLGLVAFVYPLTFCYTYFFLGASSKFSRLNLGFLFFFVLTLFCFVFAVTGERDNIFRILLIVFLVLFSFFRQYKKYYLFLGLFLVLFLLPVTQLFKGFLVTGIDLSSVNQLAMREVLFGEFSSSSRNIHTLYTYGWEYQYGYGIISDILRSIPVIGRSFESSTYWYNSTYRVENGIGGTSGWGFSLIGQGLVNFGLIGVFFIFFLVGIITRYFRQKSLISRAYLALYLYFLTMVIYSIRADLSNVISQGVKNGFISLGLLMVISWFLSKKNRGVS
ncbi:O-antigen polymerase [Pseudoalteromonas sp. YIC-827]|uniref:O-antigen polymerase n=1 Tax=Pseudoalteromonas qingdaonensis TaxID=3131913 RepID=A0ABU9MW30_9GAMM